MGRHSRPADFTDVSRYPSRRPLDESGIGEGGVGGQDGVHEAVQEFAGAVHGLIDAVIGSPRIHDITVAAARELVVVRNSRGHFVCSSHPGVTASSAPHSTRPGQHLQPHEFTVVIDGAEYRFAVFDDRSARMAREAELLQHAFVDELTGLLNRGGLRVAMESLSYRLPSAVLVLDVDNLKDTNDEWGHGAGDQLLIAVADSLRTYTPPLTVLGRVAGDEFVAVISGEHVDGTRDAVARFIGHVQHAHSVSVGVGYVVGTEWQAAVTAADTDMFRNKKTRRHRVTGTAGHPLTP